MSCGIGGVDGHYGDGIQDCVGEMNQGIEEYCR